MIEARKLRPRSVFTGAAVYPDGISEVWSSTVSGFQESAFEENGEVIYLDDDPPNNNLPSRITTFLSDKYPVPDFMNMVLKQNIRVMKDVVDTDTSTHYGTYVNREVAIVRDRPVLKQLEASDYLSLIGAIVSMVRREPDGRLPMLGSLAEKAGVGRWCYCNDEEAREVYDALLEQGVLIEPRTEGQLTLAYGAFPHYDLVFDPARAKSRERYRKRVKAGSVRRSSWRDRVYTRGPIDRFDRFLYDSLAAIYGTSWIIRETYYYRDKASTWINSQNMLIILSRIRGKRGFRTLPGYWVRIDEMRQNIDLLDGVEEDGNKRQAFYDGAPSLASYREFVRREYRVFMRKPAAERKRLLAEEGSKGLWVYRPYNVDVMKV